MALANLNVNLSKRETIADMTHSHIKWAKKFSKDTPFTCTCGQCASGSPRQMRAEDLFPDVFRVSNKFTPEPDKEDLKRELTRALSNLTSTMIEHGLLDEQRCHAAVSGLDLDSLVSKNRQRAVISKIDVVKILSLLN
jgi:hypothetical protein